MKTKKTLLFIAAMLCSIMVFSPNKTNKQETTNFKYLFQIFQQALIF